MRVLLISYHFPPLNVIASERAKAFARYLPENGIQTDVLTLDWCTEGDGITHSVRSNGGVRIEKNETGIHYFLELANQFEPLRSTKIRILYNWLRGYFDEGSAHPNGPGACFDRFLEQHLKTHRYDALIGIFSPHQHLRSCAHFGEKYNIPYVLDFRDLWSNRVIHDSYRPRLVERIHDALVKWYWKKWLKNALFFTVTSTPWTRVIQSLTKTPGHEITNGYEPEDLKGIEHHKLGEGLQIVHIGSLYETQNLEPFLVGFRRFADEYPGAKVHFIGADRQSKGGGVTAYKSDVSPYIERFLKSDQFVLTQRVPREDAMRFLLSADLLFFPSFPHIEGCYSGKFWEYLAIGTPILSSPADGSVVDEVMLRSNAGAVASTGEEVFRFLCAIQKKQYKFEPVLDEVNYYSRKATIGRFAELLKHYLSLQN